MFHTEEKIFVQVKELSDHSIIIINIIRHISPSMNTVNSSLQRQSNEINYGAIKTVEIE